MNKFLNKKYFLILGIIVFSLILPKIASATIIEEITYFAIKGVLMVFIYIFRFIIWFFLTIFGLVLDITLNPEIINVKQAATVPWTIMRDVSNLVIIFSLLFIAFGFILDIGKFDAKKSFFKLIVVALLINYSMLFTGAVYDLSNYFIYLIKNGLNAISFSGALDIFSKIAFSDIENATVQGTIAVLSESYQKIYGGGEKVAQVIKNLHDYFWRYQQNIEKESALSIMINGVLNLILLFVFGSSLLTILVALSLILLLRVGMFIFLIILSPLAFSLLVLSFTQSYFNRWLNELIRWAIYPPLVLFFVYLTLLTAEALGCLGEPTACGFSDVRIEITSPFFALQNLFIVVMFFLTFLFANNVSSGAVAVGKKVSDFFVDKLLKQRLIGGLGGYLSGRLLGGKVENMQKKLEAKLGRENFLTKAFIGATKPIIDNYERIRKNRQSKREATHRLYTEAKTKKEKEKTLENIMELIKKDMEKGDFEGLMYWKELLEKDEALRKNIADPKFLLKHKKDKEYKEYKKYKDLYKDFVNIVESYTGKVEVGLRGEPESVFFEPGGNKKEITSPNVRSKIENELRAMISKKPDILARPIKEIISNLVRQGFTRNIYEAISVFLQTASDLSTSEIKKLMDDRAIENVVKGFLIRNIGDYGIDPKKVIGKDLIEIKNILASVEKLNKFKNDLRENYDLKSDDTSYFARLLRTVGLI